MKTDINYWVTVPMLAGLILLIIWIIKHNQKDEKQYEKELIRSEMKPEKHDEEADLKP